jgi:RluA family pseudouridine synthase
MERKAVSLVGRAGSGMTLAAYLTARFSYLSKVEWLEQIEQGRLRLNGAVAAADRLVAEGDSLAFDSSGIEEPEVEASIAILHEDEDFLVVDKSGSLPCHPGGRFFEHSLWFILKRRYAGIHIATRLDRETSGLVLVCKSAGAARYAQLLQASRAIEKTYLALVHGSFPERALARGFLIKDEASAIRKKRSYVEAPRREGWKEVEACETQLALVGSADCAEGAISLVRARPATGRTHQIRATLLGLGFPVVGDKLYGLDEGFFLDFAAGRLGPSERARLILPHQALHCAGLAFADSAGREIRVRSEPRWGYPYSAIIDQLPCLT